MASGPTVEAEARWADATLAASVFAFDPAGVGGILVKARSGPARDAWLSHLRGLLGETPIRRMPPRVTDDRLLGGLDLVASLREGRPILQRGLLAEADGGAVIVSMADRLSAATAARLANALDAGEVRIERDGFARIFSARFGVVALDEGIAAEERAPSALRDRLGLQVVLEGDEVVAAERDKTRASIPVARGRVNDIAISDDMLRALCSAALALGISSLNAPLLAAKVSRTIAALDGRSDVGEDDVCAAARLVLAPRALVFPAEPSKENEDREEAEHRDVEATADIASETGRLEDIVVSASRAAIPANLLEMLKNCSRDRSATSGRSGVERKTVRRGTPVGVKFGRPEGGARLSLIETLRAAAPWQTIRRSQQAKPAFGNRRIEVRVADFRIRGLKEKSASTTIFVVDASGSTALHRLNEAKGAVELLLAECYVRRDQVALIAFSGRGPEVLLPPTRSLTRAKRNLASLPGGGGTPLAAAVDTATSLADGVRRRGQTVSVVFLTDGRANVRRDGKPGRTLAEQEAISSCRALKNLGIAVLLIDTSVQPAPLGASLAEAMGARYLPLPRADARSVAAAVRAGRGSQ